MSFGLRVYDAAGRETLNVDSFSMRTVQVVRMDSIPASGVTIALPEFDPTKGVVMVQYYDIPSGYDLSQGYKVSGSYPFASIVFESMGWYSPSPPSTKKCVIMGVHYK